MTKEQLFKAGQLRHSVESFWRRGWTVEDLARAARVDEFKVRNILRSAIAAGRVQGPCPEKTASKTRRRAGRPKKQTTGDAQRQKLQQLPAKIRKNIRQGLPLFPAGDAFKAPKASRLSLLDSCAVNTAASNLPIDLERGNHGEVDC